MSTSLTLPPNLGFICGLQIQLRQITTPLNFRFGSSDGDFALQGNATDLFLVSDFCCGTSVVLKCAMFPLPQEQYLEQYR